MNFYFIKILGIGFTIIIYFIYIILCIKFMNYIFNYSDIKNYSIYKTLFLFLLRLWVIAILYYIARNLLIHIPFPLDNLYGYDSKKLKEINSGLFALPLIGLLDYNLRSLANNIIIYI